MRTISELLFRASLLTLCIVGAVAVSLCSAQTPSCCSSCGCSQLQKVCRTVPEVKKETKTKWIVECEEVCLPGRTQCVDECVTDPNSLTGSSIVTTRQPSCGRIITKKKLVKKTEIIEKPGFKCVVETVCQQCGHCCP
jgi:hypothetical protein